MTTPTTSIDALPAATAAEGTQMVVIQEAGVTKRVSIDAITAYVNTHLTALADLTSRVEALEQ